MLSGHKNCFLYQMNAVDMNFDDNTFDMTICIQNGISAFHEEPEKLFV